MPIKIKQYPDQKTLKELFDYKDGNLYRKKNGKLAGSNSHDKGYWRLPINKQVYYINRLIYIWHHGEIPEGYEIDHKDLDKNNNHIDNLQAIPHDKNMVKLRLYSSNTSGYPGISFYKPLNKWQAQIYKKGKRIYLGYYHVLCKAIEARQKAEQELGFDKLHGTTFVT